ncbi:MAG: ABC transporter ATP-binding protein [Armatimonadetes bacterium]|nr:ABC transporter ATP-binding protein [Armatimonadota bacterium]
MTDVPLLRVAGLTRRFGGLVAVSDFHLELRQGELVGLIGPNGAGKTTCFNMISGLLPPSEGTIELDGRRLQGLRTYQFTQLGIARTFQNIRLFKSLSVLDNVKIAAHAGCGYGLFTAFMHGARYGQREQELEDHAMEMLSIFKLDQDAQEISTNLAYGEQRRLEIARAMATRPRLLLLDEPAAGMNAIESSELMALIRFVRDRFGITVLLIEHDMKVVMGVCERILVLDYGQTIAAGSPEAIRADSRVIEAYLGKESH